MLIGYHASHEQFAPRELLAYAGSAAAAGFDGIMSSEHIAPWSVRQGNSGFAWSWLGAAMQATASIPFGALAIPGGWRYHPVVAAHAFATLAEMFPNRMRWIAAGSGEAMNEHVVARGWPPKTERNARLLAAVDIMRALWRGETVTRDGPVPVHAARLWSLPARLPAIYGAALSVETAGWLGSWADGLLTIAHPPGGLDRVVGAFRANGGAGKPVIVQLQVSWAATRAEALHNGHDQWRHVAADCRVADLEQPEDFDAACAHLSPEDVGRVMVVATGPEVIQEELRACAAQDVTAVYLHNAGRNQAEFIRFCGTTLLPARYGSWR